MIFKNIFICFRMNDELSKDIIDLFNKKTFIEEWCSYKYKEKSIRWVENKHSIESVGKVLYKN